MTPITGTVDVASSPDEVFAYIADPTRRPEWQHSIERIEVDRTSNAGGLGTRVRETRRVPGRTITATWEVTEFQPGHRFAFRGIDGPVRPVVSMALAPLEGGERTRVSIEIAFETYGLGKLFGALARRNASKEVVADGQHLKEALETGTSSRPS